jgi:Flp pilus assembly protein TadB
LTPKLKKTTRNIRITSALPEFLFSSSSSSGSSIVVAAVIVVVVVVVVVVAEVVVVEIEMAVVVVIIIIIIIIQVIGPGCKLYRSTGRNNWVKIHNSSYHIQGYKYVNKHK